MKTWVLIIYLSIGGEPLRQPLPEDECFAVAEIINEAPQTVTVETMAGAFVDAASAECVEEIAQIGGRI